MLNLTPIPMQLRSAILMMALSAAFAGSLTAASATQASPAMPESQFFNVADLLQRQSQSGRRYLPFFEVSSMDMGMYVLPAGAADRQTPHDRDEIYYIIEGRAMLQAGETRQHVGPGSIVYVKAGVAHRFEEIREDLKILVIFARSGTDQ